MRRRSVLCVLGMLALALLLVFRQRDEFKGVRPEVGSRTSDSGSESSDRPADLASGRSGPAGGVDAVRLTLPETLRIRVIDEGGRPIRDAIVRDIRASGQMTSTNIEGWAEIPRDALGGVRVTAEGYAGREFHWPDPAATWTVSLSVARCRIDVHVADRATGDSLRDATVDVVRVGRNSYDRAGVEGFDVGRFRIALPTPAADEESSILIAAPGFRTSLVPVRCNSGSIEARLDRAVVVRGRVVDETTGRPIIDAEIAAPESQAKVVTGANGEFEFPVEASGPVSLVEFTHHEYATRLIRVAESDVSTFHEIAMSAPLRVTIVIRGVDVGTAGSLIATYQRDAEIGAKRRDIQSDGSVHLFPIPKADIYGWLFIPAMGTVRFAICGEDLTEGAKAFVLEIEHGLRGRFRFTDSAGLPLVGWSIESIFGVMLLGEDSFCDARAIARSQFRLAAVGRDYRRTDDNGEVVLGAPTRSPVQIVIFDSTGRRAGERSIEPRPDKDATVIRIADAVVPIRR